MLIFGLILSYLIGALPTGYILTRALKGVDIRKYGSGNVGATNVYRVVGPAAGIIVLILDILKGAVPVVVLGDLLLAWSGGMDADIMRLGLGVAAVCGHNWPVFLRFKGGKGVATSAGVLLGLSLRLPQLGLLLGLCIGVWLLGLLVTGFVSLASILAALALPIFALIFGQPFKLLIVTVLLCLFVVYRHKSNISRLLKGEEKRIFR